MSAMDTARAARTETELGQLTLRWLLVVRRADNQSECDRVVASTKQQYHEELEALGEKVGTIGEEAEQIESAQGACMHAVAVLAHPSSWAAWGRREADA